MRSFFKVIIAVVILRKDQHGDKEMIPMIRNGCESFGLSLRSLKVILSKSDHYNYTVFVQ